MKLQKQLSNRTGKKDHYKYVVVIPNETVEKLAWDGDQDLICNITSSNFLLIGPAPRARQQ